MTASLILSDGDRTLDLLATVGTGIQLVEFNPPIPARENTYADSPDSEGRRRIRSQPQNPEGTGKVLISATVEADFWDYVDEFQEMIESVHANRGVLRYEPPRNAPPITFDIESIQVTGLPQQGVMLNTLLAEGEFAFECLPYGRLDPVTIFTGQSFAGPIASVNVTGIPGHVNAWPTLTLTDASSQARGHVEVAVQEDYDPANPEPLLLNRASGITSTGYAGSSTTRAGSYSANVTRATLTSSPVVVCATTAQPHKNRWKVRSRFYPSTADVRVRLAWQVGDGPITHERWVDVPNANDWFDLDLETIAIQELATGHSWTGYIEAYATTGTPTLDHDIAELLPA